MNARTYEHGNFTVKLIKRESGVRQYEAVRGDGRWWTVAHDVMRNHWFILNERLTSVSEFGGLGSRIVKACENAFQEYETDKVLDR